MAIRKLFSGVGLVVLASLVLVSTLVTDQLFKGVRIDLTENNLYTLSDGSKNIVENIQRPVNLYFFFSKEGTREALAWRNYAKQVQELLEEFALASDGKVRLHVVDPEPFSEEEDQAAEYGLEPVSLGAGDPVYFGLAAAAVEAEDATGEGLSQSEIIPFFQPDRQEFLEYDIARLIYQVSLKQKPKVGLLSGLDIQGGFDMMQRTPKQPWVISQQLSQLFDVEVLPFELDEIEADIELLVIVHPKALSKSAQYAIDQHVLRGGRALVFVDPFAEQDVSPMAGAVAADRSSDLPALFRAWGITYDPLNIVGDYQLALQVSLQQGMPPVKHLGILQFTDQNHVSDDMIISQLETLNFSTVGYISHSSGATTTFAPLLQTTEYAMPIAADKLSYMSSPTDLAKDFKPTGEHYVVAARLSGKAKTAFPDGVPVEDTAEDKGDDNATEGAEAASDNDKAPTANKTVNADQLKEGEINVLVVADTDILSDRLWVQVQQFFGQQIAQPFADNGAFYINSVDNLSGSSDLMSIRSRGRFLRPFTVVQEMQREAEADFREKEQGLQQRLEETEQRLMTLQGQRDDKGNQLTLSPEQEAEVIRFQEEKLRIRKDLRSVQHQLNRDIDQLDVWLKLINIALVPAILTVFVILVALVRRRKAAVR